MRGNIRTTFPKHSEFTYGIQSERVHELLPVSLVDVNGVRSLMFCDVHLSASRVAAYLDHMESHVMGAVRSLIAKHDLLRQLIGYSLLWKWGMNNNPRGERVFAVYKRNKKNGEGQLSSMLSIGFGGHVENVDVLTYIDGNRLNDLHPFSGMIDLYATLDASTAREMGEETELTTPDLYHVIGQPNVRTVGFVYDSRPEIGYVGNHHLGVVYSVQAHPNTVFRMKEEMNDVVGWATIDQLDEMRTSYEENGTRIYFEPWSDAIIRELKEEDETLRVWPQPEPEEVHHEEFSFPAVVQY